MEAAVGERQGTDVEADVLLAVAVRPAEAAQVDGVPGDESACIVSELELQPWRRDAVRVHPDAQVERLAGEELEPIGSLLPDESCRGDRRLTGAPLAQADASLCRIRIIRESPAVARHGLARGSVEGDVTPFQEHRALAEPLDGRRIVRDEHDRSAVLLEGEDAAEALALERLITDGEHLVEEQDVGVEERRDREAEPHGHSRRVRPYGPVD